MSVGTPENREKSYTIAAVLPENWPGISRVQSR